MPDEWRTYKALSLGISLDEVDHMSARRLDELLAIDRVVSEVEAERTKE